MKQKFIVILVLCLSVLSFCLQGDDDSPNLSAELRFRYEQADDSIRDVANAYTGRFALKWNGGNSTVRTIVEVEHVSAFLGEEYNDGGANQKTKYAVIADPVGTEVNQAFLLLGGDSDWAIKVGRHELAHRAYPWQRYLGTVSWRQNEQTMDGMSVAFAGDEQLSFHGAWIKNVNRIFGENNKIPNRANFELDGLMLTGAYKFNKDRFTLEGFLFDLDFDDAATLSSQTIGARFDVVIPMGSYEMLYTIELASQSPTWESFDSTSYRMIQGSVRDARGTLTIKNELLGASGSGNAFGTPLATLHIHQGWADKFLSTPSHGLSNTAFNASGRWNDIKCTFEFNSYSSDGGDYEFGSEFGTSCSYAWKEGSRLAGWTIGAKFTSFSADDSEKLLLAGVSVTDTNKFWFWFQRNFSLN